MRSERPEGGLRSSAPRWARRLVGRLAGPARADEVVGDLEEAHRDRVARRGPLVAAVLTGLETLDMAAVLLRERGRRIAAWHRRRALPHPGVMYHPLAAGGATSLTLTLRVVGDRDAHASRMRLLALQVDPPLRIEKPLPLEYLRAKPVREYGAWLRVVAFAGAIALLLALAGIYAVMAFTVSRRTREIGVRVALGAVPRQVTAAVLARSITHVGIGVFTGAIIMPLIMVALALLGQPTPRLPHPLVGAALLTGYMALMMAVCMLACIVPTRRALRVQPTVALSADA